MIFDGFLMAVSGFGGLVVQGGYVGCVPSVPLIFMIFHDFWKKNTPIGTPVHSA